MNVQILAGAPASVSSTISALEQVDASAISNVSFRPNFDMLLWSYNIDQQVTSTLLKSKPTFVAVGNTQALPHADELGL